MSEKNSMDWTHQQALAEVQEVCKDSTSEECPDGLLIIALWNTGGKFDTRFWNVGMKVSELIALLEVQKHKLLEYMENEGH